MKKIQAQVLVACTSLICATVMAVSGIEGWIWLVVLALLALAG